MATYISDEETCRLINEYAERVGKNKTAALRDLLVEGMDRLNIAADKQQRFARVWRRFMERRRKLEVPAAALPKHVFDDLFEIEDQRARAHPTSSKARKKSD